MHMKLVPFSNGQGQSSILILHYNSTNDKQVLSDSSQLTAYQYTKTDCHN